MSLEIDEILQLKKIVSHYGINEVSVIYSGGGDSGGIDEVNISYIGGHEVDADQVLVPKVIDLSGRIPMHIKKRLDSSSTVEWVTMNEYLRDLCHKYMNEYATSGWEINEGGGGALFVSHSGVNYQHYNYEEVEEEGESSFEHTSSLVHVDANIRQELKTLVANGPLELTIDVYDDGSFELQTYNLSCSDELANWLKEKLEDSINAAVENDFYDTYGKYTLTGNLVEDADVIDGALEFESKLYITGTEREYVVDSENNFEEMMENSEDLDLAKRIKSEFVYANNIIFNVVEHEGISNPQWRPAAIKSMGNTWIDVDPKSDGFLYQVSEALSDQFEMMATKPTGRIEHLLKLAAQKDSTGFVEQSGYLQLSDKSISKRSNPILDEMEEFGPNAEWKGLTVLNIFTTVSSHSSRVDSRLVLEMILDAGADVFYKNGDGHTHAEFLASTNDAHELRSLIQVLDKRGVQITEMRTPLVDAFLARNTWLNEQWQEIELRQNAELLAGVFVEASAGTSIAVSKPRL